MNNISPALRQLLREAGHVLDRQGKGDPEIWRHPVAGVTVTIDNKIKPIHLANKILRDAGLPKAF